MTFDSERISRKQECLEKTRAYDIISLFKEKKLNNQEILACIEAMFFFNDNTETQIASIKKAQNIITHTIEQEKIDAKDLIRFSNSTNIN